MEYWKCCKVYRFMSSNCLFSSFRSRYCCSPTLSSSSHTTTTATSSISTTSTIANDIHFCCVGIGVDFGVRERQMENEKEKMKGIKRELESGYQMCAFVLNPYLSTTQLEFTTSKLEPNIKCVMKSNKRFFFHSTLLPSNCTHSEAWNNQLVKQRTIKRKQKCGQ